MSWFELSAEGRYHILQQAMDILQQVGLEHRIKHLPSELSGGELQRAAIARAIVTDPAIILADEPTGNLDTATGEEIMAIFKQLNADGGTIIVVTHESSIAAQCGKQVHLLDGRIISEKGKG